MFRTHYSAEVSRRCCTASHIFHRWFDCTSKHTMRCVNMPCYFIFQLTKNIWNWYLFKLTMLTVKKFLENPNLRIYHQINTIKVPPEEKTFFKTRRKTLSQRRLGHHKRLNTNQNIIDSSTPTTYPVCWSREDHITQQLFWSNRHPRLATLYLSMFDDVSG